MDFYNLTQCADRPGRKLYLRSTDIEQRHWRRLLWGVPDELLYEVARGGTVRIIDRSTKERGKIERIFVPVLLDVLEYLWFGAPPQSRLYRAHYRNALREVEGDNLLRSKFITWKRLGPWRLDITGITLRVEREPNPIEQREVP